ncbi:helix-turn-helix domain-containing protein [Streptomyces sp. WAC05374]|uniref:helix-turn-helix domain-containing protein n=1 Tax=Streptomyces sp. WAC05374 TaxID=2487420 RepID=UPI0037DCF709
MGTETEGFAEALRGLKERSGLSYGVLAKRAHMSTSTLHRYCNGDAVPTEFAPVERLARLCGASRDEMVALHRRWIVADDAKRRGRAAAMQGVAVPWGRRWRESRTGRRTRTRARWRTGRCRVRPRHRRGRASRSPWPGPARWRRSARRGPPPRRRA